MPPTRLTERAPVKDLAILHRDDDGAGDSSLLGLPSNERVEKGSKIAEIRDARLICL